MAAGLALALLVAAWWVAEAGPLAWLRQVAAQSLQRAAPAGKPELAASTVQRNGSAVATALAPLVVYGDASLPPYEFLEDGRPAGLTVDLWRLIGERLGRPVELRLGDWARSQAAVLDGDADVLTALTRTADRERDFLFTQPLVTVPYNLFAREDDVGRVQRSPIESLRIGVTAGGFPRRHLAGLSAAPQLVIVNDTADGIRRLLRGDIDALAAVALTAGHFLREFRVTGVEVVQPPFASVTSRIGVHRRNPELLARLDAAIAEIRADGSLQRVVDRWSGPPPLRLTRRELWTWIGFSVAAVVVIGLAMLVLMQRARSRALLAELARRREVEAELERQRLAAEEARAAAERATRARSEFLANMSHEIRTPMNAIVGLTRMLRHEPGDPGADPHDPSRLRKIDAAARHLISLVSDVLDLSKIDSGKLVLDESDFRLDSLLASVQSHVAHEAEAKGLVVRVEVGDCPWLLIGDATRLRQALINYASNAVKFTARGTVTLRGRVESRSPDEPDVLLHLEVEDTGIGVPAEFQGRLFEVFEQASASTTRQYGGTGLGLSITRRLAEMMGGEAGYASRPGQGSRFWLTARVRRGAASAAPAPSNGGLRAAAVLRERFGGTRVLIAEDNEVNLEVATALAEAAGLAVVPARNGQEAVDLALAEPVALVLMDMQMPGRDGLSATLEIRRHHTSDELPIIALTANAFDEDRRACLEAGMNAFVSKPVDPDLFYEKLLLWLDRRAATDRKTDEGHGDEASGSHRPS